MCIIKSDHDKMIYIMYEAKYKTNGKYKTNDKLIIIIIIIIIIKKNLYSAALK
jgi:hypothetical protein